MKDYTKDAQDIIKYVGGVENVVEVEHCWTRIRFKLKDDSKVNTEELEKIKSVVSVMKVLGVTQVVIGNEIDDVYKCVEKELGDLTGNGEGEVKTNKSIVYYLSQVLTAISGTVTPILPGLLVTGLLKAILVLLSAIGILNSNSQTYNLMIMATDTFFYFLPVLGAYSASRHFKCNTVVTMILACMLINPTFISMVDSGEPIKMFGLPVHAISYSSSLIPIIITAWVQSIIEKLINKTSIKKIGLMSLAPTFILMVPITLIITAPIGSIIGEAIASAMLALYNKYYVLGVFAICFLMPLFIVTGSHWIFMPTALANKAQLGFDPFLWIGFAAWNFSQLGVSLAVALKTKSKDLKQYALSSAFSIAAAGISEPCVYGLTLKLKTPIIPSFVSCGVAGLFFGLTKVKCFELVNVSCLSLAQFIDPAGGNNFILAMIGIALSFAISFGSVMVLGFDDGRFTKE